MLIPNSVETPGEVLPLNTSLQVEWLGQSLRLFMKLEYWTRYLTVLAGTPVLHRVPGGTFWVPGSP